MVLVTGSHEGGGRYSTGIYRPTDNCVMRDPLDHAFCPVCSRSIDEMIAGRTAPQNENPRCGLWVTGDNEATYFGRTPNGLKYLSLAQNGVVLGEIDLKTINPLLERLPLFQEISASVLAGANLEVRCVDSLGKTAASTIKLQ